jgi:predicted DNA-binding antitoxin AbrB/MazE fold protein
MTITIDATYENGVLKPAQPLPLSEHAQVRVTVEPQIEAAEPLAEQAPNNEVPLWEQILALTRDLPPEAFEGLPTDGASQHDHYIYGSPKRKDLRDKPE